MFTTITVTKAPNKRAQAAAAPAEQADTAEHRGDDRGQRVGVAGRRIARRRIGGEEQTAAGRGHAAQRIGEDDGALDRNAVAAGGHGVVADGIDRDAEPRAPEDRPKMPMSGI